MQDTVIYSLSSSKQTEISLMCISQILKFYDEFKKKTKTVCKA